MAGEILTEGLSAPQTILVGKVFTGLDYINISHVVGMLYLSITLSFVAGKSNKLSYKVMSKEFGSTTWQQTISNELDATDGSAKTAIIEFPYNRAWLVAIMPMQNIVRNVECDISLKAYSNMNVPSTHTSSNIGKKLRVGNNMKAIAQADTTAFANWDSIQNLSSSINLSLTTSPGVLMQDGQWIFGQN